MVNTVSENKRRHEGDEIGRHLEKKTRTHDTYKESDKRLRATQNALDRLLQPNNMQLDSRERRIYEQTKVELEILNKGEYAINALRSLEDAFCAARRAHLKALIEPGKISDPKTIQAWMPVENGLKWQKTLKTIRNTWKEYSRITKH